MRTRTRPVSKTIYLNSNTEQVKDGLKRAQKIEKVALKMNITQSAVVRIMIDAYNQPTHEKT